MLRLTRRDENGKLISGHLFLTDARVQQSWMNRLKRSGFTYRLTYADVQGKFSIMFSR